MVAVANGGSHGGGGDVVLSGSGRTEVLVVEGVLFSFFERGGDGGGGFGVSELWTRTFGYECYF